MNKEYIKNLFNHPILLLLYSFGIPLSALFWSYVSDVLDGNSELIIITVVIFVVITIVLLIVQAILSSSVKEEFYDKVETLEGFIEATGAGRVSSDSEMLAMESVASDVTVITPDLKDDIQKNEVMDAVSQNLNKNIKYHYIMQDTTATHGYLDTFARIHGVEHDISITFIPEEHFFFSNDIIIYNLMDTKKEAKTYFSFPSANFNLFVKLDDVNQQQVLGVIRKISASYTPKHIKDFASPFSK